MRENGLLEAVLRKAKAIIKAELARNKDLEVYLKKPQSRVSEWLGGQRKPNGEIALQLVGWVESIESSMGTKERRAYQKALKDL